MEPLVTEEHRPNILVVEDEHGTAELIRMMLRARGYRTELLTSGAEAIELVEAMAEGASPWRPLPVDMVLLDIMMQGVDGFKVCQTIKDHDLLRHIPVVMVTALDSASDKMTAVEFGADGYITKPFLPEELDAAIKARLQVKAREEALLRRNVELEAISAVCAAAGSTLDPRRVVIQAFEALMEKTEVSGAIYVVDEREGRLQCVKQEGIERPEFLPIDSGLAGQVLRLQQSVLKTNLAHDPDSPVTPSVVEAGSYIAVPLRSIERTLGVLEVYHRDPYGFEESMLSFFAHVGDRIGMSLQNAEIFQHAQMLLLESSALSASSA